MTNLREAMFYQTLEDARVRCELCPHECLIRNGKVGACGVRVNRGGRLSTLVYDRVISHGAEAVEKKPLFHFLPNSTAYSIGTAGCNLKCAFCQNWQIAHWPRFNSPFGPASRGKEQEHKDGFAAIERFAAAVPGEPLSPEQIVDNALRSGAASVAYTYTEPTIFYELAYETAGLARKAGLRNIFVTNGFTRSEPLRRLGGVLDAANIDLKFFREESYRRLSGGRLQPVLEAIRSYHELGLWIEVTTLIMAGINDSEEELRGMAAFIRSVGREIPWHLSRFFPAYEMVDHPVTPLESLHRARRIGHECGLRYIYLGNVPGEDTGHTCCPACGSLLVERSGSGFAANRMDNGHCRDCGTRIEGVWSAGDTTKPSGRT